jgi:hypothetical protein
VKTADDLFTSGLAAGLDYLDREVGLCRYHRDGRIGFDRRTHDDAQASVITAAGLLHRGASGDRDLALKIVRALARTPPSWNAGFRLAFLSWLALAEGRPRIALGDRELEMALREALAGTADHIAARRPDHVFRPGYTNFWLLDLVGLHLAGCFLGRPDLTAQACAMGGMFAAYQKGFAAPEEFNSPHYLPVQMIALLMLEAYGEEPWLTGRAREWKVWLWRHALRHYDRQAGVLMGHWSRAYANDLDGTQMLVRLMMCGAGMAGLPRARPEWIRGPAPDDELDAWGVLFALLPFSELDLNREHDANAPAPEVGIEEIPSGPNTGRPRFVVGGDGRIRVGSVSEWHLWEQTVPLAVHRMGSAAPLVCHHYPAPRHAAAWFQARQAGVGVLAAMGGIALSDRTNLDAGVATISRGRPEMGEHILEWSVAGVRLYVGGADTLLCERDLPAGVPVVVAGDGWCISLLFGPAKLPSAQPAIRLRLTERGFVMGFLPRGNGADAMVAGMCPGPYAWYCLMAQSTPDELAVAAFVERSSGIQVDESAPDVDPVRVSVVDGLNSLELPFSSRVQEARDWGSNGWSVYEDDSRR